MAVDGSIIQIQLLFSSVPLKLGIELPTFYWGKLVSASKNIELLISIGWQQLLHMRYRIKPTVKTKRMYPWLPEAVECKFRSGGSLKRAVVVLTSSHTTYSKKILVSTSEVIGPEYEAWYSDENYRVPSKYTLFEHNYVQTAKTERLSWQTEIWYRNSIIKYVSSIWFGLPSLNHKFIWGLLEAEVKPIFFLS